MAFHYAFSLGDAALFIVNFSNQIAAGPKNISKNFLLQAITYNDIEKYIFFLPDLDDYKAIVDSSENLKKRVIFISTGGSIFKKIIRTLYVNFLLPLKICAKEEIKGFLSFGNFLLYPGSTGHKIVLLHHPYLVDDKLYNQLNGMARLAEFLKRMAFKLTVKNVSRVIVQSDYMSSEFKRKYSSAYSKAHTISNPLSSVFEECRSNNGGKAKQPPSKNFLLKVVYVSRFYPHKNHNFLLALSRELKRRHVDVEFTVTVNPQLPKASEFIDAIKAENLSIVNVGEVTQHQLIDLYMSSHIAIFPSLTETFGNPLIEAMCFSLPVLAADLPYAKDILGESGVFYNGTVEDCTEKLLYLLDSEKYAAIAKLSFKKSLSFPSAKEWYESYREQLEK